MAENTTPIRVYIENAADDQIGGFTIPLPTTREALAPWFAAIEADMDNPASISIVETRSSTTELGRALRQTDYSLDEINYLAAKIGGLDNDDMEIFRAALGSGKYDGDVGDIINLIENLDCLQHQPATSEEQYGSFLLETASDETAEAFQRLQESSNAEDRDLAAYILDLEGYIDHTTYGRKVAEREQGVFTSRGYLTEKREFQTVYYGSEDIPLAHRIFTLPMMAAGVDMPSFLAQLHAVAGDFSRDMEYNIGILSKLRSAEYLLLTSENGAYLTETMHAYRYGSDAFERWMNNADKPGAQAFAIHLTEVHGQVAGDVARIDAAARKLDILENCIHHVSVEATMPNGTTRVFQPEEWDTPSLSDKSGAREWRRVFTDESLADVREHLRHLNDDIEAMHIARPEQEFLAVVNTAYMESAQNPQPDMLRVSQTAAKEMLARGDCEVYRLLPGRVEKLSQMDAVKSGLWYSEYREFAIRREDMEGLQKWADRSAGIAMGSQQERGEHRKSNELEV